MTRLAISGPIVHVPLKFLFLETALYKKLHLGVYMIAESVIYVAGCVRLTKL